MKISKYNKINGKLKKRKTRRIQYKKRNNRHITKHNKHKRTINRRQNGRNKTVRKKKGGFISPALVFGSAAGIGVIATILGLWKGEREEKEWAVGKGGRQDGSTRLAAHTNVTFSDMTPQQAAVPRSSPISIPTPTQIFGIRPVDTQSAPG